MEIIEYETISKWASFFSRVWPPYQYVIKRFWSFFLIIPLITAVISYIIVRNWKSYETSYKVLFEPNKNTGVELEEISSWNTLFADYFITHADNSSKELYEARPGNYVTYITVYNSDKQGKVARSEIKRILSMFSVVLPKEIKITSIGVTSAKPTFIIAMVLLSVVGAIIWILIILAVITYLDDTVLTPHVLIRSGLDLIGELNSIKYAEDSGGTILLDTKEREQIKHIYTSLKLKRPSDKEVLMFSSSGSKEGSTTLAYVFASISMSFGKKILLIDCNILGENDQDLDPSVTIEVGLADILRGQKSSESVIHLHKTHSNFFFLPAGKEVRADKSILLQGHEFEKLLEELKLSYDTIILYTPPLLVFSESLKIASLSTAVILIAAIGKSKYKNLMLAYQKVKNINENSHVIINEINRK